MERFISATDGSAIRAEIARRASTSPREEVREYLTGILPFTDSELVAWFMASDDDPHSARPQVDAVSPKQVIYVIERVCSFVANTITVYDAATKTWQKITEHVEKCKDVKVPVPSPEPGPPPGPSPV